MLKKMIKRIFYIVTSWLLAIGGARAQSQEVLTLEKCHELAARRYPLVRQYALIEKTREYSIANASKGILPQLHIAGQATYQSAVTQIPISLPNLDIPVLSKDQYKLYGEISQPVTDLVTVRYQKELIEANSAVEQQKIEVELYKLKERINQLYFGILLIDARIVQTGILKKDIESGISKNKVAIANGIVIRSSADLLRAEWLKADQRAVELKATRKGYTDMLALFVDQPVDENTLLQVPPAAPQAAEINRPELRLFDMQKITFGSQSKLIDAKTLPRFSLFLQGGYGRPALNMLSNGFDPYYIGGVRLSWNLSAYYTYRQEKQLLSLSRNTLDVQKETFLFNTLLTLRQQNREITRLEELIETDRDIIALRENVKASAQNQLEYGTATANDYLTYINAEDQAKQDLILHQLQLLMARYDLKTISGN